MSTYFLWMSMSSNPIHHPQLSLVIGVANLFLAITAACHTCYQLTGGRTYTGFAANSRTLAILRFRASTLYIHRKDVSAVFEEGSQIRLNDGSIINLKTDLISCERIRREFQEPFFLSWGNQRPVLAGALRVEEKG